MTDYAEAQDMIEEALTTLLTPLITNGTINELIFGGKVRGAPEPPYLQIFFGEEDFESTNIGSGVREPVELLVDLVGVAKELYEPHDGQKEGKRIISKARNLILADRKLGIPSLVRLVTSSKISPAYRAQKGKKTVFAGATTLKITYIIDNQATED